MSEEQGSFFGQLKNQIIAGVGVAITAAGATFMDAIKEQLGLAEPEPEKTEEVVQQPVQQPNITINVPEQKTETKTVIVKEAAKPAPPKKTKEEKETEARKDAGFDW
jgi:outer membrane biosynthesis protein TonB